MSKITNFHTILGIAFGMNALLYWFDVVPHLEKKLAQLLERNKSLTQEKVSLTKNSESFPIAFLISSTHPIKKAVFEKLTILVSLVILAAIGYSSFYPESELSNFWIATILIMGFGLPIFCYRSLRGSVLWVEAANRLLEADIAKASYEKSFGLDGTFFPEEAGRVGVATTPPEQRNIDIENAAQDGRRQVKENGRNKAVSN